jgi:uncharacterized protein YecT (DUF1311 family)
LKDWLNRQQRINEERPSEFDDKFISLLDTLNPLLGYDWRIYYRPSETHFIETIRKLSSALKSKRKLPSNIKVWINEQRYLYRDHPTTYPKTKIEQLDALIPLLGYDWKEPRGKSYKIPFEMKIAAIRSELEKGNSLSRTDRHWIASYRRKYVANNKALNTEQINLLNTLNPLLICPWNQVTKTVKKYKNFVAQIRELRAQGLPYELLSKQQQKWLTRERRKYRKRGDAYSKEKIKALDSLDPVLKRDWKKYIVKVKKHISFEDRIKEITRKLTNQIVLTKTEKEFMGRQRFLYEQNTISKERIQKLNILIPLLGYDWRKKLKPHTRRTFEENFSEIKLLLKNGKTLSKKQRNWIYYQKESYLKDPEGYPTYHLNSLDTLNQFLKKNWAVKSRKRTETLSFEESLAKIRLQLITGKALSRKQQAWLSKQRLRFKNNHPQLNKKRIASLDSLNILLGYDWKKYLKER